ncbi:hypothetical protein KEM48_005974 [Puccinia striiformis f. sp. tritici PST-130]|nr:hypothetical protein KEM48_005974 [Puccinia striiformis f. sp. tritici PST-130]
MGVPIIRKHIAEFLEKRDGFPADPETIYLTAGASAGVSNIMQLLLSSPTDGVMIPIHNTLIYGRIGLKFSSSKDVYKKATNEGTKVKAMVLISPGNPVGNCLSRESMESIVRFCFKNKILLLADEVYQTNIFKPDDRPFISFKSVVKAMEPEIANGQALINFHSISKGQTGECGRRGGYFELVNIPEKVQEQVYKLADESYELFKKEVDQIAESLKSRSNILAQAFNELPGLSCNYAQGAMYLFPKLVLPSKAHQAAEKVGVPVDEFYCMELLTKTGICIVPGSGFGQQPGSFHFRTTFLAPQVVDFVTRFKEFHLNFLKTYE